MCRACCISLAVISKPLNLLTNALSIASRARKDMHAMNTGHQKEGQLALRPLCRLLLQLSRAMHQRRPALITP